MSSLTRSGCSAFGVWFQVMQALRVRRPLNLLNAEALAAALVLDASVFVTTDSPLLRSGAAWVCSSELAPAGRVVLV